MKNKGQITIGLKIALGIISAGVISFGGWMANSLNKNSDINRQQDIKISQDQANIGSIDGRLERIEDKLDFLIANPKEQTNKGDSDYQDWINAPAKR